MTDRSAALNLSAHPHRRLNLLTGEWLLVSPHRAKRPWHGDETPPPRKESAAYDTECYLCPTNVRANGTRNPSYDGAYVFSNDFPALTSAPRVLDVRDEIFPAPPAAGAPPPSYAGADVFSNDFPALTSAPRVLDGRDEILRAAPAAGEARVVC